jgi:hypothetical protein
MTSKPTYALTTLLLILCIGGTLALWHGFDSEESSPATKRATSSKREIATRDAQRSQMLALHSEFLALRREVEVLRAETPKVARQLDEAPLKPEPPDPAAVNRDVMQERDRAYGRTITGGLHELHDGEGRDNLWSAPMEDQIVDTFAGTFGDQSALMEVDCRTTLCRLLLRTDSTDAEELSMFASDPIFAGGSMTSSDPETGTTEIYLFRPGRRQGVDEVFVAVRQEQQATRDAAN